MYTVQFNFEEKGKEPITINDVKPGLSLLEVALLNDINLHHNCGGVCACSTCHLYVNKGEDFVEELSDREEDFIDRARNPKITSRLGCQCILLDGNGVLQVAIPDQTTILGEED
jgi:ferredoxin, 2Fe-2S